LRVHWSPTKRPRFAFRFSVRLKYGAASDDRLRPAVQEVQIDALVHLEVVAAVAAHERQAGLECVRPCDPTASPSVVCGRRAAEVGAAPYLRPVDVSIYENIEGWISSCGRNLWSK
jgi:hypothetical protein